MGIGKTLSAILAEQNIAPKELAERLGMSQSTIYSVIKRDNTKIEITVLARICRELSVPMERFYDDYIGETNSEPEITFPEREMIKKYRQLDSHGQKAVDSILDIEYERCTYSAKTVPIEIPMSIYPASAGTGNWIDEEYTERVKVIDTPESRRANIVIEVSGDSMKPKYNDGDKVLVKIQPDVELGETGIFIVDGSGYIKNKGKSELISVNPEYENIPITEFTEYKCFGKVLGIAEIVAE